MASAILNYLRSTSAFARVLWGLALGILTGLFFGETVAFMELIGTGYIRLLQMTVLPYVLVSLLGGLGRLNVATAKTVGIRGAALTVTLWLITLLSVLFLPWVYPDWRTSTYFSPSLLQPPQTFDPLMLYLPSNPFYALANGIVPAVVVFSILLGVALIGVPNKERLLDGLQVLSDALMRVASAVGKIAPLGIFAISAAAAGTLRVEELTRLQVFLWGYVAVWTVLAYFTLPLLVARSTPFTYGQVVRTAQVPMITALATGTVLVVIPMIVERTRALLDEIDSRSADGDSMIDLMAPTAYSFPTAGTLLGLGFILFAGWYVGSPLTLADYPSFVGVGAFVAFGSMAVAIPFMLDFYSLPADLMQLYLLGSVFTARMATALAALHGVVVCLIGPLIIAGAVNLRQLGAIAVLGISAAAAVCLVLGLVLTHAVPYEYSGEDDFINRGLISDGGSIVYSGIPEPLSDTDLARDRLAVIRERGSLRVGYEPDAMPYAYRNATGQAVGLDIDLAHALARDLDVDLEVIRIERGVGQDLLAEGRLDLLVGGWVITPDRALELTCSAPYISQTLGLVVLDYRRDEFADLARINDQQGLRVAIPNEPYYVKLAQELLPNVEFVLLDSAREFFTQHLADALIWTAEGGSAWSLVYPQFMVLIPTDPPIQAPVAFALPRDEPAMARFVDTWIDLTRKTGELDRYYRYWIYGENSEEQQPRWSIARDVLGWL